MSKTFNIKNLGKLLHRSLNGIWTQVLLLLWHHGNTNFLRWLHLNWTKIIKQKWDKSIHVLCIVNFVLMMIDVYNLTGFSYFDESETDFAQISKASYFNFLIRIERKTKMLPILFKKKKIYFLIKF